MGPILINSGLVTIIGKGMNDKIKEMKDLINAGADVNLGVTIPKTPKTPNYKLPPVGSLIWLFRGYTFSLYLMEKLRPLLSKGNGNNKGEMGVEFQTYLYSFTYYTFLKALLENGADPNKQWACDEIKNEGAKASGFFFFLHQLVLVFQ